MFRIFLAIIFLILLLVFTLQMNDSVKFTEGHIYSDTPQLKIIAPNEVKILKVFVKEGQEIKKGDTLFVFENKKIKSDFDVANIDVKMMQNKIAILFKLITSTQERKKSLQQLLAIQSNIYYTDREKVKNEITSINKKINLSSQQTSILNDKYKTDSLLYSKGAISRYELTETKSKNIDDRKNQVDIKSNYNVKNYDFENLANNYQKTINDLNRAIIDIDNQLQNYNRDIIELKAMIADKRHNLTYITDELEKLTLISPINGTISNLFNAKQNLETVNKSDLLAIIAPKKEQFYAKIILAEKDLSYIKKGQEINLKLDAYNYYLYGPIKGKITYISPSDVDKTFYCLANMQKYNPNIKLKAGYVLKGEVIIEEMFVSKYMVKQLFNKIEDGVN
jgi:multidrug resistance efflux pump